MATSALGPVLGHIRKLMDAAEADQLADGQLLERFVKEHDQTAFEALVRRHGPSVLGVCRRVLHDVHTAEDASQATFLLLARKAAYLDRGGSMAGWLYTVAFRLALRARTRSCRGQVVGARLPQECRSDPLEELTGRELCIALEEELQRLPTDFRLALLACCVEGNSREEAARRFGWTVGQVKARLERGRQLLRRRLSKRGLTFAVALLTGRLTQESARAAVALWAGPTARAAVAYSMGTPLANLGLSGSASRLLECVLQSAAAAKAKMLVTLLLAVSLAAASVAAIALASKGAPYEQAASVRPEPPESPAEPVNKQQRDPARTDQYGDPLPPGALARLGSSRFRLGSHVTGVGYTADGKSILATGLGEVCVCDAASGKERHRLSRFAFGGCAFAVSPDQKTVAATNLDGNVQLWDLATRKQSRSWDVPGARELPQFQRAIRHVAFSPDGQTFATAGPDGVIRVWNPATGEQLRQLTAPKTCARLFAYFPDGAKFAYGHADGTVRVCQTASGQEILKLKAALGKQLLQYRMVGGASVTPGASALDFTADGKILVTTMETLAGGRSAGSWVQLWDTATGKELPRLNIEEQDGAVVAVAADGKKLASGHRDGSIRLWDRETSKELRRFHGHGTFGVTALAFSADGKTVVSGGYDQTVRQWDIATGQELHATAGHQHKIHVVAFSPDGRTMATTSEDKTIRLWDAHTGMERHLLTGKQGQRLEISELIGESGAVGEALLFSPDGRMLISNCKDSTIRFWDAATGRELRRIQEDKVRGAGSLALSPDGKVLAASELTLPKGMRTPSSRIVFWDADTGKELRTVTDTPQLVFRVAFTPDSRTLLGLSANLVSGQVRVHLWDVASGKEERQFDTTATLSGGMFSFAFSPDGRRLALQHVLNKKGELALTVWDVATGKEVRRLANMPTASEGTSSQRIEVLAFSPDGRILATRLDGTIHDGSIHCWEIASGKERRAFAGQTGRGKGLAFSPDGTLLASGGYDTTALVWDVACQLTMSKAPLSPAELAACWTDLAGADALQADRAIWTLVAHPNQAVALLRNHLQPVKPADAQRVARLIVDLDSNRFAVRNQAAADLEKLGELAQPGLLKAKASNKSAEVGRQIDILLEKAGQETSAASPMRLRLERALETLEHIGTPEAHLLLKTLAGGTPEAGLTQQAKLSTERLDKRLPDKSKP